MSREGGGRGRLWGQGEGGVGVGSGEKQADTGWGTEGLPGDGDPGRGLSWVEQVALKVTWGVEDWPQHRLAPNFHSSLCALGSGMVTFQLVKPTAHAIASRPCLAGREED